MNNEHISISSPSFFPSYCRSISQRCQLETWAVWGWRNEKEGRRKGEEPQPEETRRREEDVGSFVKEDRRRKGSVFLLSSGKVQEKTDCQWQKLNEWRRKHLDGLQCCGLQRWPPTSMTSSSRATYACAAASWGWVGVSALPFKHDLQRAGWNSVSVKMFSCTFNPWAVRM